MDRMDDGRVIKILTLIDEYTKEALAVCSARRIRANDVIDIFADVMVERGVPEYIRSENGPEIIVKVLRNWLARVGTFVADGTVKTFDVSILLRLSRLDVFDLDTFYFQPIPTPTAQRSGRASKKKHSGKIAGAT